MASSSILTPDPKFYGRRKGRPIRARKSQLMDRDFPNLALPLPAGPSPMDPADFFDGAYDYISLEMGFGGGEHLAAKAAQNPHHGFIGIEAFENGVASLLEHITRHALSNIRIYNDDGRPFLRALKPESLDQIFVLFPDPWPKKRHHKRRLLQVPFLKQLYHLLKPNGTLFIATDHEEYALFIHDALGCMTEFGPIPDLSFFAIRPPDMPPTRYEQKGVNAGRISHYFQLKRV